MNHTELTDAIKAILIEPISTVTTAYIDGALKRAQRSLEDAKVFRICRAEVSFNSISDGYYGLSIFEFTDGDWNGTRDRPYWVDGDVISHEMEWIENTNDLRNRLVPGLWNADPGTPKYAYIREEEDTAAAWGGIWIFVNPTCDALNNSYNGSYHMHFPYWKRLEPITSIESTNWFGDNCYDYLTWAAAADCFLFDKDTEGFMVWGQRAAVERVRLIKQAKRDQFMGTQLRPRRDANASSRQGRV